MLTPKNVTELKAQVRDYIATHPEARERLRQVAQVDDNPDLFGWVRMWLVTQHWRGVPVSIVELFGF